MTPRLRDEIEAGLTNASADRSDRGQRAATALEALRQDQFGPAIRFYASERKRARGRSKAKRADHRDEGEYFRLTMLVRELILEKYRILRKPTAIIIP